MNPPDANSFLIGVATPFVLDLEKATAALTRLLWLIVV
jgi:hypothetical protein